MSPASLPLPLQVLLALMLVVPLGPMICRLAYQPIAEASILVLLIVSVVVHVTLIGLACRSSVPRVRERWPSPASASKSAMRCCRARRWWWWSPA